MMKKKRDIIIICVIAVLLVSAIILALFMLPKSPNMLLQREASVDMTDGQLQKARKMNNAVILSEGDDITLTGIDSSEEVGEAAEKMVKSLSSSVFDSIILKTEYLCEESVRGARDYLWPNSQKTKPIFSFLNMLSEKKIKSFLQLDISHSSTFAARLCENEAVTGIVIIGTQGMSSTEINDKLSEIYSAVKNKNSDIQVELLIEADKCDISKLEIDNEYVDSFLIAVPAKQDLSAFFSSVKDNFKKSEINLCFPIGKCSDGELQASWLLEQMMKADDYDFVSSRVFDSYSAVKKDFDCCFTAIETFISSGVNPSAVFSNLIIEDYDGQLIQTNSYKLNVNIRGSYLYPVSFGKEKITLSESGKAEVELTLKTGENVFVFKQNGNEVEYKVNVTFDGDLISSVEPSDLIYVDVNQSVSVKVTAAQNADVTIRLGTEKYTAKQGKYVGSGYSIYTVKIKMPSSKIEIESLGSISVTAVLKDKSASADGAKIVYMQKEKSTKATTTNNSGESENEPTAVVTLPADNYNGYPTENNVTFPSASASAPAAISAFTTATAVTDMIYPSVSTYTGSQMCVVSSAYADTWPLGNDDKYVPYYTTLAQGTMDYVIDESQVYDSEEQETRTFYTLASGRRIQQKSVSLVEKTELGDNAMSVLSSTSDNGELKIILSTKWKVPYSFNFLPQEYYSAKGKLYNVRSFTASYVQFTFYYTTSVNGQVDASGSNTVSSATWSVDQSQKTVVLTLPLRTPGGYYGYSLEYDVNGNIILTIRNKPNGLSGSIVLLDPGHGGKDPGASGYSNWLKESDVNFSAAVMVKNELESRGATVYMTRYEDKYLTLEERKAFARAVKPDVFVSIHSNASEDTSAYGTSVYYYRPMSQPLSQSIYSELVSAFKNYLYPGDTSRQSGVERGSNYNPFSVTRLEECPSVLIEMGFITNETECRKLADEECRQKIAVAIANGIENYLTR